MATRSFHGSNLKINSRSRNSWRSGRRQRTQKNKQTPRSWIRKWPRRRGKSCVEVGAMSRDHGGEGRAMLRRRQGAAPCPLLRCRTSSSSRSPARRGSSPAVGHPGARRRTRRRRVAARPEDDGPRRVGLHDRVQAVSSASFSRLTCTSAPAVASVAALSALRPPPGASDDRFGRGMRVSVPASTSMARTP